MEIARYPSLAGRTVLVTGGATGIGESIVRHFAMQGARVGFIDINVPAAEALMAALADSPAEAFAFEACDLTDIDALQDAIGRMRSALGPITVLVNNAANDDRHGVDAVTSAYWDDRIAVNLKHQFFAAQAVSKDMAEAGGGAIINIGSVSWMIAEGGMPCYTTAKSAVQGLTRALARDLGPMNIRVTSVAPGWIMTERQQRLWVTEEAKAATMDRQCLKRMLEPADVARAVLFMASDEAGAITNTTMLVDAGLV